MKIRHAALAVSAVCLAGSAFAQSSTATYRLTFDATWTSSNHPGAYPNNAHFSPIVGATHNDAVTFWEPGGLATPGIELMAETGGTSLLRSEVNAAVSAGTAHEVLLGAGINSPGSTSLEFDVPSNKSLFTLVTMIAPSPDWFVGTHGLSLRDSGGEWIDEIVVELEAYDAGTEDGSNFSISNPATIPAEPISDFSTTPPFAGLPVLGTYTLTLLSVDTCLADVNADGSLTPTDFTAWIDAFNNSLPGCDQNGDGSCTPTDFTAWINNFNAGC
ncbi:MAG: hypothetical protein ED559_14015 [Phycisphaera sp.]|nr:MAG: hypothetical protein ED559_14015 [Phycisphaera sp.]